ncbi:hypothetical protein PT2222_230132 [Paraburkholderia tropica]
MIGAAPSLKINKDYKDEENSDGRGGVRRRERSARMGGFGWRADLSVGATHAGHPHDDGSQWRRRVLHGDHGHAR